MVPKISSKLQVAVQLQQFFDQDPGKLERVTANHVPLLVVRDARAWCRSAACGHSCTMGAGVGTGQGWAQKRRETEPVRPLNSQ